MAKIIQTRIDQRLLHGQASVWLQVNNANTVIVANNDASTNKIQQDLMSVTVPEGVRIRFYSLDKLVEVWPKAADWQVIYFIIESIDDLYYLFKKGLSFDEVNIGNVHSREDRERLTGNVNLSIAEKAKIKEMYEAGVMFNTKTLPGVTKGLVEIQRLIS